MTVVNLLRTAGSALWRSDRFLTAVGLIMLAALVPMLAGLALDPRLVTGAPAWLKPAKFAVSTAIYSLTLAWMLGFLPEWRRVRWIASRATGLVFLVEVPIISLQAWRGVASHFNVGTPLDGLLFTVMGAAIAAQTLAALAVAVALWRQSFTDRALGWALRLGLAIAIAGASTGGLMTRATATQLAQAQAGERPAVVGAHTVGGPDGGAGLIGTGWSLEHGDLRVPHFLGLHAMQVLPVWALLLYRRRLPDAQRSRAVLATAASYAALVAVLVWQALRGQSIVQPDALTLGVLAVWAVSTVTGLWLARRLQMRVPASGRPHGVPA